MNRTVDGSIEHLNALIAECRAFDPTGQYGSVRLQTKILDALAQVARERDAARDDCVRLSLRLGAAENRIGEARAVLAVLEEAHRDWCNYCHGEIRYCDPRPECACPKARALLGRIGADDQRSVP